ncbi:MAG: type II secretion system F family protein [Planctomycetes bacterium]|nr:type II secretion system F family protein [Planctomycetota bacterium]
MSEAEHRLEAAERTAGLIAAELPLEAGLRALAEESPSPRIRRTLVRAAERLEAGMPPEELLANNAAGLPPHVCGLLRAGLRTGRTGEFVTHWLQFVRESRGRRRLMIAALAYPAILLVVSCALVGFYLVYIVGDLAQGTLADFDTELPVESEAAIAFAHFLRDHGLWMVAGAAALVALVWLVTTAVGGAAARRRMTVWLPLAGPMLRHAALAEFCRLLALLVRGGVPLPEAFRMTAAAVRDAELAREAVRLAGHVEHGGPLAPAASSRIFPPAVQTAFRWEHRADAFAEALDAAGEFSDARSRMSAGMIVGLVEPTIIMTVAAAIVGLMYVVIVPMIKLLNDLS